MQSDPIEERSIVMNVYVCLPVCLSVSTSPLFITHHQRACVRACVRVCAGDVIATLRAHDADAGENARVRYTLIGQDDDHVFQLDARTGQLSSRGGGAHLLIDSSHSHQSAGVYRLLVAAVDHGAPPLSSTATLTVTVQPAHELMTSARSTAVGVSVYVTSSVLMGCALVAAFLLAVAAVKRRRRRRQDNRHHDDDEDMASCSLQQRLQHDDTAQMLTAGTRSTSKTSSVTHHHVHSEATSKPASTRPLRDLQPAATTSSADDGNSASRNNRLRVNKLRST